MINFKPQGQTPRRQDWHQKIWTFGNTGSVPGVNATVNC